MDLNKFHRDIVAICTFSNKAEQHLAVARVTYCYLDFIMGRSRLCCNEKRTYEFYLASPPIDCNFLNEWTHAPRKIMWCECVLKQLMKKISIGCLNQLVERNQIWKHFCCKHFFFLMRLYCTNRDLFFLFLA